MSIGKWLNKKAAMLSLALGNVEKNTFAQNGEGLSKNIQHERRINQGTLMDSLINGEVTEEVQNLRWRIYKILEESEKYTSTINGYDSEGVADVTTKKRSLTNQLSKVKVDQYDKYPLEMVITNDEVTISIDDSMYNDFIIAYDKPVIIKDEVTGEEHAELGEISSNDYFASTKSEKPITIERKIHPKFYIENYASKLNVRVIDSEKRLLEFYVSKYPDEMNRNTGFFINEIKKSMDNPITSSTLEIDEVKFITYKVIGADDFLEFNYRIEKFDKIVEFNGHYVIKFIGSVIVNGENILEKYKREDLDKKYDNKEKKK
jgi:hypothetical protein